MWCVYYVLCVMCVCCVCSVCCVCRVRYVCVLCVCVWCFLLCLAFSLISLACFLFFYLFPLVSFLLSLGLDGLWDFGNTGLALNSSGHYGWDGQQQQRQQEIPLTTTNKIPPRNVDHISQQYYDDYSMPSIFHSFQSPYLV